MFIIIANEHLQDESVDCGEDILSAPIRVYTPTGDDDADRETLVRIIKDMSLYDFETPIALPGLVIPRVGTVSDSIGGVFITGHAIAQGSTVVYAETYSLVYGDTLCRTFVVRQVTT